MGGRETKATMNEIRSRDNSIRRGSSKYLIDISLDSHIILIINHMIFQPKQVEAL